MSVVALLRKKKLRYEIGGFGSFFYSLLFLPHHMHMDCEILEGARVARYPICTIDQRQRERERASER